MDAISILKRMHENVKTQVEELLQAYNPFEARAYWRHMQRVPARVDSGEVCPPSSRTRGTCGRGFTR